VKRALVALAALLACGGADAKTRVKQAAAPAPLPWPCGTAKPATLGIQAHAWPKKAAKEPAARAPYHDPVFGTCVVRVSDRAHDLSHKGEAVGITNEYSRVQPFNADGSLLLLRSTEATWYVYDARTLLPKKKLTLDGAVDPRWDAKDPDLIYYSLDTRLVRYHVSSDQSDDVRDFKDIFPGRGVAQVWGRYEGSPSDDGRRWAFMATTEDGTTVGLVTFDLGEDPGNKDQKTGRILGVYDFAKHVPVKGLKDGGPDNVSISHSGKYVLVPFEYCERDAPLGTFDHPCGAMVFDADLKKARPLLRTLGHEDLVVLANGHDGVVFQDTDTDNLSMFDLETLEKTDLYALDFSKGNMGFHVSGRGFKRPGWAVVSAYTESAKRQRSWMVGVVFLVELQKGGRVVQIAHHHSLRDDRTGDKDYFSEPHTTTNPDMTRIVWTSNWGRVHTNVTDVYMAELPEGPPK
jgi:hypothetical protein